MLIKKFVAATMNEALAKVKAELGDDAVILQSRKVDRGGLMALTGKAPVEVTAATPDRHPVPPTPKKAAVEPRNARHRPTTQGGPPALLGIREYATQSVAAEVTEPTVPATDLRSGPGARTPVDHAPGLRTPDSSNGPAAARSEAHDKTIGELRGEIEALKGSIHDLAAQLVTRKDAVGDGLDEFRAQLRENGASPERVAEVLNPLAESLLPSERDHGETVEAKLHEAIAARFSTSSLRVEPNDGGRPFVIAVVGPTGVGKTTSLAKLATNFDMFGRLKVALISTDTYRVAAVEQLRTFAGIAGLPLDVVYRAEELPAAIDRYRDYDILLIDTAGRSQNDTDALRELREFIDQAQPDRTLLALSANTRPVDQRETLDNYKLLRFSDVMLTKLDEVSSAGHLLDLSAETDVPWVFLTTGQAVPDDILSTDPYLLAAMVVRREYFLHLREQGFQMSDNS